MTTLFEQEGSEFSASDLKKVRALISRISNKRGVKKVIASLRTRAIQVILNRYFIHSEHKLYIDIPAIADELKQFGIVTIVSMSPEKKYSKKIW